MVVELDLNSKEGKELMLVAEFMVAGGVDGVTHKGLLDIAVRQFYHDFAKLNTFKEFLKEKSAQQQLNA